MLKYIFLFLSFICFTQSIVGQQRFKAGLVVGLNASQINGDQYAGFNKLGVMGGLKAAAILGEKSEFGVELLFSQRGSQSTLTPNGGIAPVSIHLNYVEIPVTYTFMDWEADDFYRMHFHAGLSYGRLINGNSEVSDALVDEFNQNDFAVLVGVTYFASEHFGLGFRYNRSVIPLKESSPSTNQVFWGFFLNFNATYIF